MNEGNYAIKEGSTTVAYLQVTRAGATVMPKGIKASALATLQDSLEAGVLPEGLTAKELVVEATFNRVPPDWKTMTPSPSKRMRWLKARGKVKAVKGKTTER